MNELSKRPLNDPKKHDAGPPKLVISLAELRRCTWPEIGYVFTLDRVHQFLEGETPRPDSSSRATPHTWDTTSVIQRCGATTTHLLLCFTPFSPGASALCEHTACADRSKYPRGGGLCSFRPPLPVLPRSAEYRLDLSARLGVIVRGLSRH